VSDYKAIATVTATLRTIIEGALKGIQGIDVKTERPNDLEREIGSDGTGVNIFLYQVETDADLRNADLPSRSRNGHVIQRPQVALKLNYLLTFYATDGELVTQQLLGKVVSVLHTYPVIVPGIKQEDIETFKNDYPFVTEPNLTNQQSMVRITPLSFSLEELSKLWSVFFHTPYRMSIAYQASVVLIEADITPSQPTSLVSERKITVLPAPELIAPAPVIQSVSPQMNTPGDTLTIHGQNFSGGKIQVTFDGVQVDKENLQLTSTEQLEVELPDSLLAGIRVVQVALGVSSVPDLNLKVSPLDLKSNVMPFVLQPKIDGKPILEGNTLTLKVKPKINPKQTVTLWLRANIKSESVYGVFPEVFQDAADTLNFNVSKVPDGTYRIRLQVDQAESPFDEEPRIKISHPPPE